MAAVVYLDQQFYIIVAANTAVFKAALFITASSDPLPTPTNKFFVKVFSPLNFLLKSPHPVTGMHRGSMVGINVY